MQENIESNSVPVPTVVPANDQQPKANSFLVILLSVLLFISVLIAGFFAYQTQKLVKELTVLKLSPTPVSMIESTPDPDTDWKTYTNSKFSFKYPDSAILTTTNNNMILAIDDIKVNINPDGAHQWGEGMSKDQVDKLYLKSFQYPDKPELLMYPDSAVLFYVEFNSVDEKILHKKQTDILDQILSTFKFIETSQISEETEVRNFADIYAKTYIAGDWTKLKTLLTNSVTKEMSAGMTSLPTGGYSLDGYKILTIAKDSVSGNYSATIQFTKNGQPYKNPTGDPIIIITKENELWKSISWYLYQ